MRVHSPLSPLVCEHSKHVSKRYRRMHTWYRRLREYGRSRGPVSRATVKKTAVFACKKEVTPLHSALHQLWIGWNGKNPQRIAHSQRSVSVGSPVKLASVACNKSTSALKSSVMEASAESQLACAKPSAQVHLPVSRSQTPRRLQNWYSAEVLFHAVFVFFSAATISKDASYNGK